MYTLQLDITKAASFLKEGAIEAYLPKAAAGVKALEEGIDKVAGWTVAPDNFEGIRVNADKDHGNGWLLLRKSLHDPIMPLNIESDTKGGCKIIAKDLYEILKSIEGLVINPLEVFINND